MTPPFIHDYFLLATPNARWLSEVSGQDTESFSGFLEALRRRHDYFHSNGCRLSDHGLDQCFSEFCSEKVAATIFAAARSGQVIPPEHHTRFAAFMMLFLGQLDAEKGWTKQLHLGAMRNNNSRLRRQLGPDTGFDSIGDFPQAAALASYLNRLDQENTLPKMILYNLNPADNYIFATLVGNFQDGSVPGKVQFGSGWWFLDQKEAMEWQLKDEALLGPMIRNICYGNARSYFGFPAGQ